MAFQSWTTPPPTILAEPLTQLPKNFRKEGVSEHSKNQNRGLPLGSFLEGPCIVGNTLYLTDIPYGRIFSVNLDSKEWELIFEYNGEPNGLVWHARLKRLFIADFKMGILCLDPSTKQLSIVMNRFNGERLKGPGDLVITKDDELIFTDQGMSGLQDPSGRVYRIGADGRADVLLRSCPSPNGLVLDAAQTTLFVAMTCDNSVWAVPLYPDGSVQRTGRFSTYYGMGGPDGMATDTEGNIFVAHSSLGTVFVHDKDGSPKCRILTTQRGCRSTNLTWGGLDKQTLYIVESESGSIMTVQWDSPGLVGYGK